MTPTDLTLQFLLHQKMKIEPIFIQIRQEREIQGVSQEKLGKMTGLEQSAIARLEKGEKGVQLRTLTKVAIALGKRITII